MYLAVESGGPDREGLLRRESGVRYLVPIDAAELRNHFPQISDPAACSPWEVLLVCRSGRTPHMESKSEQTSAVFST